jgi:stage II sporulation protein D
LSVGANVGTLAEDGVIAWHNGGKVLVGDDSPNPPKADDRWGVKSTGTSTTRITLRPSEGDAIRLSLDHDGQWSAEVAYPGVIHLTAGDAGGLEVVNELDLERYVGCVVANEVWPTFDDEAFRAQAIVSRSFVLYQMSRRPNAPFDVSATQGSQVYRGIRDDAVGRRAVEAAEYTRGIVCTWRDRDEDRLFCTYYSAACGGVSQSAALLGPEGDVPPLRGGVKCDYCKIAPADTSRWGPVRIAADEVLSRLIERYPDLATLGGVTAITPLEQTPSGRLISLRITGQNGATHDMLAERFRLAVGPTVIRSTDCRIRVKDGEMIFENGKGYGHGLGLCQWGMQGLAQSGKRAAEILRFYYPDAKLTRAY